MKSLSYSLFLAFLFLANSISAQVREQTRAMSLGNESALVIRMPDVDAKLVEEVWQNYLKDAYRGKTKWNRKEKEWFTDDVSITAIGGSNTVDLYTVIEQTGNDVELAMWCDLGGVFLSSASHRDRYEEAEEMLERFSMEVAKASVQVNLDQEEKKLKDLENEFQKLQKDNERLHKEIEKAEETIRKAREDISKNEKDQEAALKSIDTQKEAVEEVKKRLKKF